MIGQSYKNNKNLLSDGQIAEIFRFHRLAQDPKIERINIGFTNEVHRVEDYIFKLYLRPDGRANYKREAELYKRLEGRALTPKLVLSSAGDKFTDKPYVIYHRIPGEPLGSRWHELTDNQRREIIRCLCGEIKTIASLEPEAKLDRSWQSHVVSLIGERLEVINKDELLPAAKIQQIRQFVEASFACLENPVMGFIYWDIHLDNIIVDEGKMVGLIDLEHVDPVSLDYLLCSVSRMVKHPKLNLSEEMEPYAKRDDYSHLLEWFKDFYPQLFDFPNLEMRLRLYELEEVLRMIPRFPEASQLYERLELVMSGANAL